MSMTKDKDALAKAIATAGDAKEVKENPYFQAVISRLRDKADEELRNLPSTATSKFEDLARCKEFLAVIMGEINSDIRAGKIAKEAMDNNGKKKSRVK